MTIDNPEYTQISAFLRPDQIKELDELGRREGIHSRQPYIRWAIDAFLLSKRSTYRSEQQADQTVEADAA